MRSKIVVAAVVRDAEGNYLVTQHPRWDGHSFPMNDVAERSLVNGKEAIRAVEQDLGIRLPDARVQELEFLVNAGTSGSTGELTSYDFHLFEVSSERFNRPNALAGLASSPLFLSKQQLLGQPGITWSTRQLTQEFTTFSDVVVTLITRAGPQGTEVLLVWSSYWGGYFFPTQRCGSDAVHPAVVKKTLRDDLGYLGDVVIEAFREDITSAPSSRFGSDHHYVLHFYRAELLGKPTDPWSRRDAATEDSSSDRLSIYSRLDELGLRMKSLGKKFVWAPLGQLKQHAISVPGKADRILFVVNSALPDLRLPGGVKAHRGAVAVVRREGNRGPEFLTIWDDSRGLFGYLGGECLDGEFPLDCLQRHLTIQLGLQPGWLVSDPEETGTYFDYLRVDGPQGTLTQFKLTMVEVAFSNAALRQSEEPGTNLRWLNWREIRNGVCDNGPRVDPLLTELLHDADLLPMKPQTKLNY